MRPRTYPSGSVRALLQSGFITPPTRAAVESRLGEDDLPGPRFFDAQAFATLRAACARLIPQRGRARPIDLAGAIDERLADGKSDGWRYATMPPDGEAYRRGLRGLDEEAHALWGADFTALDGPRQDEALRAVQRAETVGETWWALPARRFFEELLAELAECYYSDPLTQEEIGYVGMADARGWRAIGLDQLEPWEPRAVEDAHEHEEDEHE